MTQTFHPGAPKAKPVPAAKMTAPPYKLSPGMQRTMERVAENRAQGAKG